MQLSLYTNNTDVVTSKGTDHASIHFENVTVLAKDNDSAAWIVWQTTKADSGTYLYGVYGTLSVHLVYDAPVAFRQRQPNDGGDACSFPQP